MELDGLLSTVMAPPVVTLTSDLLTRRNITSMFSVPGTCDLILVKLDTVVICFFESVPAVTLTLDPRI